MNYMKDKPINFLDSTLKYAVDGIDLLVRADQYCRIITGLTQEHGSSFLKTRAFGNILSKLIKKENKFK